MARRASRFPLHTGAFLLSGLLGAYLVPEPGADLGEETAHQALAAGERLSGRQSVEALRQALTHYRQALDGFRKLGEREREPGILRRIGEVCRGLGDPAGELRSYEEALALARSLRDRREEVAALNLLGPALRRRGEAEEARRCNERALELAQAIGDRPSEASALNNLAVLADLEGEMERALLLYRRALAIWRERGERRREAGVLENLGVSLSLVGRLEEAGGILQDALELRRSVRDRRGEATTLLRLGWVHYLAGRVEAALPHYERARQIGQSLGDRGVVVGALDRLGTALLALGRLDEALAAYLQALREAGPLEDPTSLAHVEANLGRLYDLRGEAEQALAASDRALVQFRQAGERHAAAHALYVEARAERRLGHLAAARTRIEETLGLVEEIRAASPALASRASLLAQRHSYYEFAIDLRMQLAASEPARGHEALALHLAERARARALLDLLEAPLVEIRREVPPQLLQQEDDLLRALAAKERERMELLSRRAAETEVAACEAEIAELLLSEEALAAEIRLASPRYAAFRPGRPLGLAEIQSQLPEDGTLLLLYALGEERSHLWVVDRRSVATFALPPRAQVEEAALRFYELLTESHQRRVQGSLELAGERLAALVLGPVAGRLDGQRLLVVADGALHYVPFAALPLPARSAAPPLLVRHEVVHLPSASVLAALRRRASEQRRPERELALVADPVVERQDPRLGRVPAREDGGAAQRPGDLLELSDDLERSVAELGEGRLRRLPGTAGEAMAIADLLAPGEALKALGFAASRQRVVSGELGAYRILHFATHGLLNPRHAELSGVVLSLFDQQGREQDGFLRVHDILRLELSADLVVLSACRTALGKEVRGEGLVGLPQAFLVAGAPRVLVSLWGVRDRATAELMARFYRAYLVEGKSAAAALREAQLSFIESEARRAPYHWAAFTLYGEWD